MERPACRSAIDPADELPVLGPDTVGLSCLRGLLETARQRLHRRAVAEVLEPLACRGADALFLLFDVRHSVKRPATAGGRMVPAQPMPMLHGDGGAGRNPSRRGPARSRRTAGLVDGGLLARKGGAEASVARRLDALLADAARPRRHHGALRPRCSLVDAAALSALPLTARRALAGALPDRGVARGLGHRGRDPQYVRRVLRSGPDARGVEPRHHRRSRLRRTARARRREQALRLRRLDPRRDDRAGRAADSVAAQVGRSPPSGHRLARPCRAAGAPADAPGHPRARPDQHQRADRRDHRRLARQPECARVDQRGVPDLHAPAGDVLGRDRNGAVSVARAGGIAARLRRVPEHHFARAPPDRVPSHSSKRRLGGSRGAVDAADLPAWRVYTRPDAGSRRLPRRLLGRAHVQRDDAPPQPGVLQPAVELAADRGRAREPVPQRGARSRVLLRRHVGNPARHVRRQRRGDGGPARPPAQPPRPPRVRRRDVDHDARRRRVGPARGRRLRRVVRPRPRARPVVRRAAPLGGRCARGRGSDLPGGVQGASREGAEHVASVAYALPARVAMPQDRIRNFSIIAHIDHGKSTLADRILELTHAVSQREMRDQLLDTMELERERGITIKAQAVRVEWKGYQLNLIDTPGHVDFTYEVSRSLQACEGALLVVDAAQGTQAQTLANAYLAVENDLEIVPVVNKIDLSQADPDAAAAELADLIGDSADHVLRISAKTGQGVEDVLDAIVERVPAPAGDADAPARALIFDSSYDQYRGVVAFVRVVDGSFSTREPLRAMAQGTRFEAEELGFFAPTMRSAESLSAGEVGYVITGLKDVSKLRVGDTLTSERRSAAEPLPGYKDVKPMVFAGLFPTDSDDYPELRDALEKLKLNDAALFYEPETSQALGFGFRCGFLGLLHMEIVRERLEREFHLC